VQLATHQSDNFLEAKQDKLIDKKDLKDPTTMISANKMCMVCARIQTTPSRNTATVPPQLTVRSFNRHTSVLLPPTQSGFTALHVPGILQLCQVECPPTSGYTLPLTYMSLDFAFLPTRTEISTAVLPAMFPLRSNGNDGTVAYRYTLHTII
jgi:hypothetical protein